MISVITPVAFRAIGQFYADFSQTSDEEVAACLTGPPRSEREAQPPGHPAAGS